MGYINTIIILGGINIIAALGVAILTGYTGLFTIGHAGFMALGGYMAAILVKELARALCSIALLLGGLFAGLCSFIIGYPAFRSQSARRLFRHRHPGLCRSHPPAAEKQQPIRDINRRRLRLHEHPQPTQRCRWWSLAVVLALFFAHMFVTSQYGKNCIAVSQDEVAAQMMGVNLLSTKMIALFISAFYAGVAGGLMAFYFAYLTPVLLHHHTLVRPAGGGGVRRHPVADRARHHSLCPGGRARTAALLC